MSDHDLGDQAEQPPPEADEAPVADGAEGIASEADLAALTVESLLDDVERLTA